MAAMAGIAGDIIAMPTPPSAALENDAADNVNDGTMTAATPSTVAQPPPLPLNKKLLVCRRFKDSGGVLRNFNSLPLFVYATSMSTHATSADGVGVAREAAAAVLYEKQDIGYDMANGTSVNHNGASGVLDCLPMDTRNGGSSSSHTTTTPSTLVVLSASGSSVGVGISSIQHQLNLSHHLGQPHQHHHHPAHHMLSHHHSPYSNNYPLQHVGGGGGGVGGLGLANGVGGVGGHHHNIHSDQTKSLQELQHEVGALLEFRDLVIETFPDLKHKMASMSSSSASSSGAAVVGSGGGSGNASVSTTNTLTGGGAMSSSSLASRREWEPGIRVKRKLSQKEPPSTSAAALAAATSVVNVGAGAVAAGELSSSSLTRSRSNSHSGKKEPKSGSGGENNNGSVVQDSGFSTETSSSKEGHSASSTNGAMTVAIASNRLSCLESDDELLNLLDVIHRKSNRLREEVEHLQNYERQTLRANATTIATAGGDSDGALGLGKASAKSNSSAPSSASDGALTPQTFREHVERLSRDDIKQLRRERDRLLDKLAEMEAETLTGRIKAAKMSDQVEELISVKRDLEEQLKLAMAQKLELSSRVQQLQLSQSKSSSSQSDYSSQRNFLSSATTVLSTGGSGSGSQQQQQELAPSANRRPNTFQPVVVEQQQQPNTAPLAFHQSAGSDSRQTQQPYQLGRLDGIVSTPGGRNTKCRATDSERITAILLETSVIELQRHLLTLTVQNQVLMQKLDAAGKSKTHLAKRLDKSKDDVEDLRFQLEEKNIELEGTKAQLRVLESRIRSSTPCSVTATNSYLNHSQNDYETNRSSASTTLMLSRRGLPSSTSGCVDLSHSSDARSTTPISHLGLTQTQSQQMPPPTVTQISTPSMKAMVHLPMDEIQHHSSSTESAHEHELLQHEHDQLRQALTGQRLLSTSVGGISPFEQKKKAVGGIAASKPSKIPLPGSGKTVTYFTMGGGKPPTGRPAIAGGRSPPSAGSTSSSSASSKSSLSRSTGNLLYSKSPNSLKRIDSAQSIRKDNHLNNPSSLSTSTSRSSTSSSIPMATTPYGCKSPGASASAAAITTTITTPSPRVLQNSPLPKPKRDSLTSRVRHLDSLSRVHQHSNNSNNSTSNSQSNAATPTAPSAAASPIGASGGGFVVSSASKPTSAIAAHLNSSLRKELQLGSNSFSQGSQQFLRRATGGVPASSVATGGGGGVGVGSVARRFGSNSTTTVLGAGARFNAARLQEQQANAAAAAAAVAAGNDTASTGSGGGGGGGSVNGGASDSDSGKNSVFCQSRNYSQTSYDCVPVPSNFAKTVAASTVWSNSIECISSKNLTTNLIAIRPHLQLSNNLKPALKEDVLFHKPEQHTPTPIFNGAIDPDHNARNALIDINAHSYAKRCSADEQLWRRSVTGRECEDEQYFSNCSFNVLDSCCDRGTDNLLVTFDYGSWSESIDAQIPDNDKSGVPEHVSYAFNEASDDDTSEEQETESEGMQRKWASLVMDDAKAIWFRGTPAGTLLELPRMSVEENVAAAFPVHRMQHQLKRSQISLFSSYAEDDFNESIKACPIAASEIHNKHFDFIVDGGDDGGNDEDIDDDTVGFQVLVNDVFDESEQQGDEMDEEEFYDSIECA